MDAADVPIACEDLVYAYRGRARAIDGLNLTLAPGELFCMLGPNGAGKTTLIRQIVGELRPSGGSVRVFGLDPRQSSVKRRMGIIPQDAVLFENLTVRAHLECFAAIKGLARATRRLAIEEVVADCGIAPFLSRPARALSGGQQRSVLVALALLGDPEILILDEPTVGLDPVVRRGIWDAVEKQRERGKTILLTTHHLEEAEHLATRLGFIDRGVMTHQGTLAQFVRLLDFKVKLTEAPAMGSGARGAVHLLASLDEAHALATSRQLQDFSVSRVTLEDVYFRLAGRTPVLTSAVS